MNKTLVAIKFASIIFIIFILFTFILSHTKVHAYSDFNDYVNTLPQKIDESQIIRLYWDDVIGWDIFAPYYLEQDIENDIKTHISCSVFGFKGKSEFSYDCKEFRYTFHKKF